MSFRPAFITGLACWPEFEFRVDNEWVALLYQSAKNIVKLVVGVGLPCSEFSEFADVFVVRLKCLVGEFEYISIWSKQSFCLMIIC